MKKTIQKFAQFSLILAAVFFIVSCGNNKPKGDERNIVVFHSWDDSGEDGEYFRDLMQQEFYDAGINAKVHHIYANMRHRSNKTFTTQDWPAYLDSIRNWKPELILMNDDPILSWMIHERPCDSLFFNTPIVYAGINDLIRDSVSQYHLMTGFGCNMNITRCIEMMQNVTDGHLAYIELDNNPYDTALRKKLAKQISDSTRFINNNEKRLPSLDDAYLKEKYPSMTVVDFVSCADPQWNGYVKDGKEISGSEVLMQAIENAAKANHIQVKYDIYSSSLLNYSDRPQFTCIRAMFNNPKELKILGGFFTSTEVQVKDQVEYAVKILRGTPPAILNTLIHTTDFYMDYNAMQLYKPTLKYSDFASKYHIINAPMALKTPVLYYLIIAIILLLITGFIVIMALLLYNWRQKAQKGFLDTLMYENKIHELIFVNSDDTPWHISDGNFHVSEEFAARHNLPNNILTLSEFQEMVHPDSTLSLRLLEDFRNQRGKRTLRFKLSFDNKQTWSWYEFTYSITEDAANSSTLYGIMLNIDKQKDAEETLAQAQKKASEIALKESFLTNISHDLRTPLNAITGFSSLLANKDMTFEEGEREEYGKIIHQNTDMILNMIDSVMERALLESGEIELIMTPTNIKDLVQKVYLTNKVIAPPHLKYSMIPSSKDFIVNIDATRTMQVLNNFLGNAFKFTVEGSIILGWREHPEDDTVEVYVKDTGIGIDEEGQKNIFTRYHKEKENDKGTGLGLNISKTIIEKQGGSIGVESKPGIGSKFFFRLPRYIQSLLLVLGLGLFSGLFASCSRQEHRPSTENILVIHGYSETIPDYVRFDDYIGTAMRKQNIHANIKNLYLGLDDPALSGEEQIEAMFESLNKANWKPDIILTEGDRVAFVLENTKNKELLYYLDNIFIIMGGLHHPNWDFIRKHEKIVAFYDPIDYTTNIDNIVELTGKNYINIELDNFHIDSIIRKELSQAIARPPYIDRIGVRPTESNIAEASTNLKDSVAIYTSSAADDREGINTEMYMNAWLVPQLSVKYDMYDAMIMRKTGIPQFTAIKAGFADGTGRFLSGYFADYNTIANDLADAATVLLQGGHFKNQAGKQHKKQYYMDYQAMEKLGMKYSDYSDKYIIVNAPIKYKYPFFYYAEHIAFVLFGVMIIAIWLVLISYWREYSENMLVSDIKQKANIRNLALNEVNSKLVRNEKGIKALLNHVHSDYQENMQLIQQSLLIEGTHQYDLYADINKNGQYEWWQLRFAVIKTVDNRRRIDGLLMNINESKKYEEDMRLAIQLAEEARQKENFLMTISHEIRTPLNAVVGFSDVLISLPPEMLSQDDLEELSRNINENNANLTAMIENILMFSRIESGRLRFIDSEFSVAGLIQELGNEWRNKVPRNISLTVSHINSNIYICADRERLKHILIQFLSNAVKYTQEGTISMTAFYHYKEKQVEIRVEDSGCGISVEKQKAVFDLFWKDNEFIPGLGLGLTIAHKLADGMGALLQVDSCEGFGSVFSLIMDASLKKEA